MMASAEIEEELLRSMGLEVLRAELETRLGVKVLRGADTRHRGGVRGIVGSDGASCEASSYHSDANRALARCSID